MADTLKRCARRICTERCAVHGEPACHEVADNPECQSDARCEDLAAVVLDELKNIGSVT